MENTNVQLEIATMTLKSQRYNEAENLFMQIATQDNSSEAWIGMAICKLYQLANGRTMDEVIFCIEKAIKISPENRADIENILIANCQVILNVYIKLFEQSLINQKEATKQFIIGAATASTSMLTGISSKSSFGKVASLAGTGVGAGVATDAFQKMSSADEIQIFILEKCNQIKNSLLKIIENSNENYSEFNKILENIIVEVQNTVVLRDKVKSEKWYDNKTLLIIITIFFFPVGFYGWYLRSKNS
jgi:hypothetical protein